MMIRIVTSGSIFSTSSTHDSLQLRQRTSFSPDTPSMAQPDRRKNILSMAVCSVSDVKKLKQGMATHMGPGISIPALLVAVKEQDNPNPPPGRPKTTKHVSAFVFPPAVGGEAALSHDSIFENAGEYIPDEGCYRVYPYVPLPEAQRKAKMKGKKGAAAAPAPPPVGVPQAGGSSGQGGAGGNADVAGGADGTVASVPTSALQGYTGRTIKCLKTDGDICVDEYVDIYVGRPICMPAWDVCPDKGARARLVTLIKVGCRRYKGGFSLACSSVAVKKEHVLSAAVFQMLKEIPDSVMTVPNWRHLKNEGSSYNPSANYNVVLQYDPLHKLDEAAQVQLQAQEMLVRDVIALTPSQPPPADKRQDPKDWIGLEVNGTVCQWNRSTPTPPEIRADAAPYEENITVAAKLYKDIIVPTFGISHEQTFIDFVAKRLCTMTPMIIFNAVDAVKTDACEANLNEPTEIKGGLIMYGQTIFTKINWILPRITVPVEPNFVREKMNSEEGRNTMMLPRGYKNDPSTYSDLKSRIVCLTAAGSGMEDFVMASAIAGQGVFRVLTNFNVNPDDILSGRFYKMTPKQGTAWIIKQSKDDGSVKMLLYFMKGVFPRDRPEGIPDVAAWDKEEAKRLADEEARKKAKAEKAAAQAAEIMKCFEGLESADAATEGRKRSPPDRTESDQLASERKYSRPAALCDGEMTVPPGSAPAPPSAAAPTAAPVSAPPRAAVPTPYGKATLTASELQRRQQTVVHR